MCNQALTQHTVSTLAVPYPLFCTWVTAFEFTLQNAVSTLTVYFCVMVSFIAHTCLLFQSQDASCYIYAGSLVSKQEIVGIETAFY